VALPVSGSKASIVSSAPFISPHTPLRSVYATPNLLTKASRYCFELDHEAESCERGESIKAESVEERETEAAPSRTIFA